MRALNRIGLLVGAVLLASTVSCATPANSEPDTSEPAGSSSQNAAMADPQSDEAAVDAIDDDSAADDGRVDGGTADGGTADPGAANADTVCDDAAFADAATIPHELADLGVPFYACVHEMVAISDSDPLFVGEYDTSHESIMIEMLITNQFDASDWDVSERTVEGDKAITHAQKPGYTLVVAIGPSRSPEATSSLHYTLRAR